jgi:large subunit ribosomal protein L5
MNLQEKYNKEIAPSLVKELGFSNLHQAPRLTKVVINAGVGKHVKESNFIEAVEATLAKITGQKPVRTKAKVAISNFKIRSGQEIGVMVTLRGKRMYEFVEKLVKATFPRVRDFRGVSQKGFDQQGNYSIGFKENLAFLEITSEAVDKIHGLQIVINTSAKNKNEGQALLTKLGFPFVNKETKQ